MGSFIGGFFAALIGIVGIIVSAYAHDLGIHVFGIGLFVFAVVYIFTLIKKHFDAAERGSA